MSENTGASPGMHGAEGKGAGDNAGYPGGNTDRGKAATSKATFHEVEIPESHAGRRLDKYLRAQLKGVPASLIFRQLRTGKIKVNGRKAKPDYRIQNGDVLKMLQMELPQDLPPPPTLPQSLLKQIEHSIIHEDAELIVLNKPADIAVHTGTGVAGGVIEALRQLRPDERDLELVHRLDRETSGLLMVAKTSSMLRHLQQVLREDDHSIPRRYLLLVRGHWPGHVGQVDAPLLRTDTAVRVNPRGQDALTFFEVQRRFGQRATLVKARLTTGRKHQIRVHARHAGHPIAGDRKYGDDRFSRSINARHMFLHSSELSVPMPDGSIQEFSAPMPAHWKPVLSLLSAKNG